MAFCKYICLQKYSFAAPVGISAAFELFAKSVFFSLEECLLLLDDPVHILWPVRGQAWL